MVYHRPSYKLPDAGRPKLSLSTSARTQPCCKASSTRLQTLLNFFLCFSLSVLFSFVFPSFLLYFYFTSQTSSDRLRVPLASSLNKLYKKKKKKFPPFFPPSFLTQKKKKKLFVAVPVCEIKGFWEAWPADQPLSSPPTTTSPNLVPVDIG